VIDLVGLEEKRDARVATLSGGQQRRLDSASA
jgi:ABC-type multidrug transport system ATPase subunit